MQFEGRRYTLLRRPGGSGYDDSLPSVYQLHCRQLSSGERYPPTQFRSSDPNIMPIFDRGCLRAWPTGVFPENRFAKANPRKIPLDGDSNGQWNGRFDREGSAHDVTPIL